MSTCSVVFIHTPCYELEDDRLEAPLGLLYLATWLNRHGYPAQIVDLASVPPDQWVHRIPYADVYGFSTYTTTYHRTQEIMRIARSLNPAAAIIAGGPHASALPDVVAHDVDYVVMGEGEQAILEIMQSPAPQNGHPISVRGAPIEDLDTLPFPDYTLVDVASYSRVVDGQRSLSVLSARGCPYHCVFCNSIIMGAGNRVRYRSAANVVSEIQQIKERCGVTSFRFQDDIFTINVPRLRQIASLLRHENISYRCFGRVDACSNQTVTDLLAESGCRHIAFGVESGCDAILKRMQKGQTTSDIRRGIANAKASGLTVRIYLIVGFPGETWDTIEQTINLMQECQPDEFSVYPLIPYPGTRLYQHPQEFGITSINHDFASYFQVGRRRCTGYVYRTADLDEGEISAMRDHVIRRLEESRIDWGLNSKKNK